MNELTKKILLGLVGTGAALGLGYWLFGGRRSSVAGNYADIEDPEAERMKDAGKYATEPFPGERAQKSMLGSSKKATCKPAVLAKDTKTDMQILACRPTKPGPIMQSSWDVFGYLQGQSSLLQEELVVLSMNNRNEILASTVVSRGTANEAIVHPTDVFRVPIVLGATRAVLAHNHPSGDPAPSNSDVVLTERLVTVGRHIGVNVLDHIIVGRSSFASLREDGRVKF
jgi:DNA repair protein RadC